MDEGDDIAANERRAIETSIRRSEARFRQLANQSPAMIWAADETGRITYLSARWHEYTGEDPDAPLPPTWDQVVHPEDRADMHAGWARSLEEGSPYDVELRMLRHDGQYRWHKVRAEPMISDRGAVTGWLGTNSDMHDAVEAREGRRRDHDRLWRISQELMLVRDFEGRILSVNPSATRILGWMPEEMIGRRIAEFIHPEDAENTRRRVAAQLDGARVIAVQNRYRCKDGSYRLIDWRGVLDEDLIHAVGRDVTAEQQAAADLRRTEEALRQSQKMEAVGQLTGGIAHDFNNMLSGIIGGLDIIRRRIETGRTEDVGRFIDAASTSAHRAAALTQRLLAFGRRQSLDIKSLDLAELVGSLEDMLSRTIGPNISLSVAIAPDLGRVKADASQLESALLNLAINARDAMPSGGTLTISASNASPSTEAQGSRVALVVRDSGTGMSPEVLARAFDPFFTTKPIGQGTGLGLSMVYGFMSQIGGDVRIDSAVGAGTSVTLVLPGAGADAAGAPASTPRPAALPGGAGETVLLVEDDASVRVLVRAVLEELGYAVLEAESGERALPIIEGGDRIDLMISDVGLPGMNGRQLAEIARDRRPGLLVLFITGYAEDALVRRDFLLPGMEILPKPFEIDALAHAIGRMIGHPDEV